MAGKSRLCWARGFPSLLAKDLCWVVSVMVTEVNYFNSKAREHFPQKV